MCSSSGSAFSPSWFTISPRCLAIVDVGMFLKSNRWQRLWIVAGTLCVSVVHRMNTTCSGGSSIVFKSALNAAVESMCTSSMMYTFRLPRSGRYAALAISVRASSTELLLAASISMVSVSCPFRIASATSSCTLPSAPTAFSSLANSRADDVLPTPRVPVKR